MKFLTVKGKEILESDGAPVKLRGACLGGWLNMENFITGFPGSESDLRRAAAAELGEKASRAFFRSFLDHFIGEDDLAFLKGLGATAVRVPFGWRHFGNEADPRAVDERGFHYLDRVVGWAKKHDLYVILDLHAAPLWQSEGWHCDNPYGVSHFWSNRTAQEWVRDLWVLIAEHYRDEPAVAGYNLLNEPNCPTPAPLNRAYREWTEAIRRVDREHLLFLEGNDYARAFDGLDEPFDGRTVYSSHNYTDATHKALAYPGEVAGVHWDKAQMERSFLASNRWLLDRDVPSWVGEFGALYDGGLASPDGADRSRLQALADQLEVFNRRGQHWTIWTYKDLDVMGLTAPPSDCEYVRRLAPVLKAKAALGVDAWTARGRSPLARELASFTDRLQSALPGADLDFKGFQSRLVHVGFYALTAGFLAPLYARCFKGMTEKDIETMMKEAFQFRNCRQRTYLNVVLAEAMQE